LPYILYSEFAPFASDFRKIFLLFTFDRKKRNNYRRTKQNTTDFSVVFCRQG